MPTSPSDPFAALVEVAAFDPSLLDDTARLRSALSDLVADEVAIAQLVTSVQLGVPARVRGGETNAAAQVLCEEGGLRPDRAAALVRAWTSAVSTSLGAHATASMTFRALETVSTSMDSAPAGPLACHAWDDGAVSVAVMDLAGLAVTTVDGLAAVPAPLRWQLLTAVQAPVSRAVALASGPHGAVLTWTDHDAVWTRTVRREPGSGATEVGEAVAVSTAAAGQPRFPVAAIDVHDTEPDVFWTVDRRTLRVSVHDALGGVSDSELPSPCRGSERLLTLGASTSGTGTGWLVASTDASGLHVARWDVAAREHDGWRQIDAPPAPPAAVTVLSGRSPQVLCADHRGWFSVVDLGAAYRREGSWQAVEMAGPARPVRALAATASGQGSWWVGTSAAHVDLLRVSRSTDGSVSAAWLALRQ